MSKTDLHNFDGVAFDIEGTLADTIPAHHTSRLAAFAQNGYGHITKEEHDKGPTFGSTTDDIVGGILHAAGAIEHANDFSSHPLVAKIKATKIAEFEKIAANGFEEVPGACDFVKLIAKNFPSKIAFVTAAQERFILPFLKKNGLLELVSTEQVITGDTLQSLGLRNKPTADPYELTKERLGAKHLLVFEDTISGIAAGKQAGATVVAIANYPETIQLLANPGQLEFPPDYVISNYAEARTLLQLT